MICPLCHSRPEALTQAHNRSFFYCPNCHLVSVPPEEHVSPDAERTRYLQHENSLDNEGYVAMFEDKLAHVERHCQNIRNVLDYGCGHTPVLQSLLNQRNYQAAVHDIHFFPEWNDSARFDLILSTETFEHLKTPDHDLDKLLSVLNPGGYLGIMTRFYPETQGIPEAKTFADWYYHRDETHIVFYSPGTFQWIADKKNMEIIFHNDKDFIILQSKVSPR